MKKRVIVFSMVILGSCLAVDAESLAEAPVRSVENLEIAARQFSDQKQWGSAQDLYRKILNLNEQRWGKDDPRLLTSLNNVVRVTCVDGKCADTVPFLSQMLKIRLKQFGRNHADTATTYALIGEANEKMFRFREARANFVEAVTVRDAVFGKTDSISISSRLNLIRVALKQKDFSYAEKMVVECQSLQAKQKPFDQALCHQISFYKKKIAQTSKPVHEKVGL